MEAQTRSLAETEELEDWGGGLVELGPDAAALQRHIADMSAKKERRIAREKTLTESHGRDRPSAVTS